MKYPVHLINLKDNLQHAVYNTVKVQNVTMWI